MSRTKALKNVKLTSFDDLFGGKVVEETAETGDVKEIPLSELHEFHNHPFQVRSDEELEGDRSCTASVMNARSMEQPALSMTISRK